MTLETIQMFICFSHNEQFFWFNDTCNKMPILLQMYFMNMLNFHQYILVQ